MMQTLSETLPGKWWRSIRRRLYSGSCCLQTETGVTVTPTPGHRSVWVVGRDCCVYRNVDMSHVPTAKREAALKLQLPLQSPFVYFGYWAEWQSGIARVWLWDEAKRVGLAAEQTGVEASTIPVVVESAFTADQEGLSLYRCQRGYMVQQWQNGHLLADSWWASSPDPAVWQQFLRATNAATGNADDPDNRDADTPAPDNQAPVDQISELSVIGQTPRPASGSDVHRVRETEIAIAVCVLLCGIISFQLVTMGRISLDKYLLATEVGDLTTQHQGVIAVRDQVYRLHGENLAISGLTGASQLELLAAVAGSLPPGAGPISTWEYNGDELEIELRDMNPDLRRYVTGLEAINGFSDIAVEPEDRLDKVKISLRVSNKVPTIQSSNEN